MIDRRSRQLVCCVFVIEAPPSRDLAQQRALTDRILASPQFYRSARLTELFAYLCRRVLDEGAHQINELELGHKVFGREPRYDTTADNTVRVHASLLRKRLAEYFANEGRQEEFTIEIPRGNYAPVFRRRDVFDLEPEPAESSPALTGQPPQPLAAAEYPPRSAAGASRAAGFQHYFFPALAILFAALAAFLGYRLHQAARTTPTSILRGASATAFWSTVFPAKQPVDVVIDDASLSYYEEATGRRVAINDYFDRTYQRDVASQTENAAWLKQLIIRRQTNYSASSATWTLAQIAAKTGSDARLQFARDLAFRQAKTDNLVLLGTPQSDPWIQLFESSTTLHWLYDPAVHSFYPVDLTVPGAASQYRTSEENRAHESYASIALLPNLGGSGRTLILSGTGGAAMDAAMEWLLQDESLRLLRSRLPGTPSDTFPTFEALLRIQKSGDHPRSVSIAIVRPLKMSAK